MRRLSYPFGVFLIVVVLGGWWGFVTHHVGARVATRAANRVYVCPHCGCESFPRSMTPDGTRYRLVHSQTHETAALILRCADDPGHWWVRWEDRQ